ncbi:DUF3313 domain-containing protein [Exilibacterium tricleocarpae]|uniref:DUF3313 domain-containing protein n=1 Tax=Exilibacterium tricleocarpae TaxID=2591008 RepID=A0A545TAI5_9GAMM|nr:DUF3313 family protein [Exilibacterium tricleocarpae]TQV74229.1 DUF3313 domain-containing protein [Exilibacterium tricleocarpae]
MHSSNPPLQHPVACLLLAVLFNALAAAAAAQNDITFDGLQRVPHSKLDEVYVNPDADFARYRRLMLVEPTVAFQKGWKREHRSVSDRDIEQLKHRVAKLFREVMVEEMEAGGHPVVTEPGADVLLARPAIIDLDITAPDVTTAGRVQTYVTSAGAATLYLELFDSYSGAILARIIDRKASRDDRIFHLSSRVYNTAEARRVVRRWAKLLLERWDEIHGATPREP